MFPTHRPASLLGSSGETTTWTEPIEREQLLHIAAVAYELWRRQGHVEPGPEDTDVGTLDGQNGSVILEAVQEHHDFYVNVDPVDVQELWIEACLDTPEEIGTFAAALARAATGLCRPATLWELPSENRMPLAVEVAQDGAVLLRGEAPGGKTQMLVMTHEQASKAASVAEECVAMARRFTELMDLQESGAGSTVNQREVRP